MYSFSGLAYSIPPLFMIIWEKYFQHLFLEASSFVFSYTLKWGFEFKLTVILFIHRLQFFNLYLTLMLYVYKGHLAPSSSDSGSCGNIIIDFYWVSFFRLMITTLCLCNYFKFSDWMFGQHRNLRNLLLVLERGS